MHKEKEKISLRKIQDSLKTQRPTSKQHLKNYIESFFDIKIQDTVFTEGHSTPLDYLWYAFNSDFQKQHQPNADCVVWANRGGGKTLLAGVVTLLDCIFKPAIQIRILSGSGYQAGRMYEYFHKFLQMGFERHIATISKSPSDKTTFKNGACVEVLKQSQTNVRGPHVHKLRCDEVEVFKPKVFEAAQYTTMTTDNYLGALECISTMHKPYGLMRKVIKEAPLIKRPVFKWNLWEVIEKCKNRNCSHCPLDEYCRRKAQKGIGYYRIDDAISQLGRTNRASFNYEMLCDADGKKKGGLWNAGVRLY